MPKRAVPIVLQDEVQKVEILKRVKRAEGQISGVIRMLEDGRNCEEVVHQIAAVNKAINTAAFTLISSSLKECLTAEQSNSEEITGKLQKLFLSLA